MIKQFSLHLKLNHGAGVSQPYHADAGVTLSVQTNLALFWGSTTCFLVCEVRAVEAPNKAVPVWVLEVQRKIITQPVLNVCAFVCAVLILR